jgi:ABC-type glycerol-3-phosphate transport system permease component
MKSITIKRKKAINLHGIEGLPAQTILTILLLFLLFITLLPLLVTFMLSLKPTEEFLGSIWKIPSKLIFSNYIIGFNGIIRNMVNTILIDSISVTVTMLLSAFVAFLFVRKKFPGKNILFFMIIVPMLVPSIVSLTTSYLNIVNLGLKNSWFGLILPYIAGNQIASIFLLRVFMGQQPDDIYEAADIDGSGGFRTFFMIALPLTFPILMVQAVQVFAAIYNDYLWPMLIIDNAKISTLMPILDNLSKQLGSKQRGAQYSVYIISGIPLIITTIFSLKFFINGEFASGLKL